MFRRTPAAGSTFDVEYRCYSMGILDKPNYETGGKIVLPASALETLSGLMVQYPMVFTLTNPETGRRTHCGVIEFIADEGQVHLPYWMMENLGVAEGSIVRVKNTSLQKGTYVKLQPQSVDFLDLSNPKAVLEMQLREFSCLTKGDMIRVTYKLGDMTRKYDIAILETKPDEAISIVEADVNVDFAAPVGYVDPSTKSGASSAAAGAGASSGSAAGLGGGAVIGPDGVPIGDGDDDDDIFGARTARPSGDGSEEPGDGAGKDKGPAFVPFVGTGMSVSGKLVEPPKDAPAAGSALGGDGAAAAGTGYSAARELAAERNARAAAARAAAEREKKNDEGAEDDSKKFKAFSGTGYSLKG